jgi:parvulin-like peptidyl-prolyl isomerase
MNKHPMIAGKGIVWIVLAALALAGCALPRPSASVTPSTSTPLPPPTLTSSPLPPTITPIPLAALVNGDEITLAEFQAELKRYQAAVGTELATEDERRVLDDLIDQVLLAQGAEQAGLELDGETLQMNYLGLVEASGGEQAFNEWMATNSYTEDSFLHALARSTAAAWMRDQIAGGVPQTAEQIHARQILLYNFEEAQSVMDQLASGADFAVLAEEYDPATGGDLGWFPRGYLLDPRLDDVVFSLQPEEHSQIIQTLAGYHILQVLERDPNRTLEPGARLELQRKAVQDWLAERRSQSQIQIFLP